MSFLRFRRYLTRRCFVSALFCRRGVLVCAALSSRCFAARRIVTRPTNV
jgi:hypothetical protein